MTVQATNTAAPPRRLWRSAGAILAGFVAIAVLSFAADRIMHTLGLYPPWGEPMHDPTLNLVALDVLELADRIVFAIAGGFITAWLAPRAPIKHAVILGIIGTVLAAAGAIATADMDLGPRWFPIAIALTGLPCCCLGGVLHRATQADR